LSLAWFARGAHPETQITFKWTMDYSFVWAETGPLSPGVLFEPGQVKAADLSTSNQISFGSQNNAFRFFGQMDGRLHGQLFIDQDNTVPVSVAAIGFGLSGSAAFAQQALPNRRTMFNPRPKFWIAFGEFEPGEVLDISQITGAQEIDFPAGIFKMKAVLNLDHSWTISAVSHES